MSSITSTPALDRPKGSFSVNSSGVANYKIDLELPPGLGADNTPSLSLTYVQGKGNGVTGIRWALTSCSSIQRSPRNLALDGFNAPVTYNPDGTRYAMDGAPLILSSGAYGQPSAVYATEINLGKSITSQGQDLTQGFVVVDYEGRTLEYGTTEDSRALSADRKHIREWHLKYNYDNYGNCITYNYTDFPKLLDDSRGTGDQGIKYLDGIAYNSNKRDNGQMLPSRNVNFFYSVRSDSVIVCGAGDVLVMSHRLCRVQMNVTIDSTPFQARAYNFAYDYSPLSGVSRIISITEEGADGSTLAPTAVEYSSSGDLTTWFDQSEYSFDLVGAQTTRVSSLLPMNITGKGLSDVCLFTIDVNNDLSAHTFLAQIDRVDTRGDSIISWASSTSTDAIISLPHVAKDSKPAFIPADLSGDGKTDLVMGFNSDSVLKFSVSRCTGEGFAPYTICETPYEWQDDDYFFPIDCDGDGRVDIVQVATLEKEIMIRSYFSSVTPDGHHTLSNITEFATGDRAANTLQWFPADVNGDNLDDLVRVWYEQNNDGLCDVYVSVYISNAQPSQRSYFTKGSTTRLGRYTPKGLRRLRIMACDINSDGIQDIVACEVDQVVGSDTQLTFKFNIFLCDGAGSFILYDTQILFYTVIGQTVPLANDKFEVMKLNGTGLHSMVYRFENQYGQQIALISTGNFSAQITGFHPTTIFDQKGRNTTGKASLVPADINGSGKSSWIAWSSDGGPQISMIPVYNMQPLGDSLLRITDPLGLCTTPTFRPISQPNVYKPAADTSPMSGSTPSNVSSHTMPILGGSQYVVSQYHETNVQSVNALSNSRIVCRYYEGARNDLRGRGWQGFRNVYTFVSQQASLMLETFAQEYPLTMYKATEAIYAFSASASPGFPVLTPTDILQSTITSYSVNVQSVTGGTTYMTLKTAETAKLYDLGVVALITGKITRYDNNGLPTQTITFSEDPADPSVPAFQQGTQTVYRPVGLRQNAVAMQKTSTVQSNLDDMTQFMSGDVNWYTFTYDDNTFGLVQKQDWSMYHNDYLTYVYEVDLYGNRISSTMPSGLIERTTYDSVFHTFPVQIVRSGDGLFQPLTQSSAFDARFGTRIADSQYNGQVTYLSLDAFGRGVASKTNSAPTTQGQSIGPISPFVMSTPDLIVKLNTQTWTTLMKTEYGIISDNQTNRTWMFKTVTKLSSQDPTGSTEKSTDYADSKGSVQRTVSCHGDFPELWRYRSFNVGGKVIAESIPIVHGDGGTVIDHLNYSASNGQCQVTSYDSLQRPVLQYSPWSDASGMQLMTNTTIRHGGTDFLVVQSAMKNGMLVSDSPPLSSIELVYKVVAGKVKLSAVSELGKTTRFNYDAVGNMISATDPGSNVDTSNYDLQGLLRSSNNQYQNPTGASPTALSYSYDSSLRLISQSNASSETILHQFDALNRRTRRVGADGRTIIYKYDETPNGLGRLTSVSVSKPNTSDAESSYSFTYDEEGRPISTALSIDVNGLKSYAIQYMYDLQGRMVSKILPDGSILEQAYAGLQSISSTMSSDASATPEWKLVANYSAYDPCGKCVAWDLSGSGSLPCNFSGNAQFDLIGGPVSRSLAGPSPNVTLVHENYITDELSRILRCEDTVSQNVSSYTYLGKRLASSTINNISNTFDYDDSGNLLGKGGIQFAYSNGAVSGTKDGQELLNVQYDASGRMRSRVFNGQNFTFGYDSFGKTSYAMEPLSGQRRTFLSDFLGRSLAEVRSDGTIKIQVSPDYTVTLSEDGTEMTDRTLFGPDCILAKITNTRTPQQVANSLSVYHTNNKGNVTRIFDAANQLQQQLIYDAFGMLMSFPDSEEQLSSTYESQCTSLMTGLINFGARDYDPVLGRFTTPDDQWSSDPLTNCDITNRYAFENNDPINHTDPTGHWSIWGVETIVFGLFVAAAAVAVSLGLFMMTAAPFLLDNSVLVGFIADRFLDIGTSAIVYGAMNMDQKPESFGKGIGVTFAIGFAFSLLTIGLTNYVFSAARITQWAYEHAMDTAVVPLASARVVAAETMEAAEDFGSKAAFAVQGVWWGAKQIIQHTTITPAITDWSNEGSTDSYAPNPAPPKGSGAGRFGGPPNVQKPQAGQSAKASGAGTSGGGGGVPNMTSRAADAMTVISAAQQFNDIPSAVTGNSI